MNRLTKWPTLCGFLAAAFISVTGIAQAQTQQYYINNGTVSYPGTEPFPPVIDAYNFINTGFFTINFTTGELNPQQMLYETWNTVNYTNSGTLMANSGFQFDTQSTNVSTPRVRAGGFENKGTISCGSVNDTGDPLGGELGLLSEAGCVINATNIYNPGTIDVGGSGLIQITGQNVNMERSTLIMEGSPLSTRTISASVYGTNNFYVPASDLGQNFAFAPPFFFIDNSIAFIDPVPQLVGGTNIIRAVFIEDDSGPNVTVSAYFDPISPSGQNPFADLSLGNTIVQWAGSYIDTASGNTVSNYLYLSDNYFLGATTNILPIAPFPQNFTLQESFSPLDLAAQGFYSAPPGFVAVFPPFVVTNIFDFAQIQLLSTVATNTIPNQSITNMFGRIEITGDNFLNLSNAQISGQYYTSEVSTNEFAGSGGAHIATPYADLNLGTTNGYFFATNTIQAQVGVWNTMNDPSQPTNQNLHLYVYNTRFISMDTNPADLSYGTNDYRVLIISSKLSLTVQAQVQNLILRDYASNSVIISDTFNVMRSFYSDAQNLTLTTNGAGLGATSTDGELNLQSPSIFMQSSLPNLRNLTNNGAFRMQNLALFGNPILTNITPAVAASGTLSEIGTNVVKNDTVTIGTNKYMFVLTLTNGTANDVAIVPSSFDGSLNNLIAAINGTGGGGYSTATIANRSVTAGALVNHAFTVTAVAAGTAGNSITTKFTTSAKSANLAWGGGVLTGGIPSTTNTAPFLFSTAFINNGIFSDEGSIIYAGNFESSGTVSNGIGSFALQSLTTTLTNGGLWANGDVSITADTLVTSNLTLQANRSLTLTATNLLTDSGPSPTNNNVWAVGSASVGSGFSVPVKPVTGDLLGTTITLSAPTNRNVVNVWAGMDRGLSTAGYTNNVAIGQLRLDVAPGGITGPHGFLTFNGAGVSNALYIDELVLTNFATSGNSTNLYNFPWLSIGNNMVVYFAQALENGNSVAEAIDKASRNGANGGRLRWIYSYNGYFSSTNVVTTNKDGTFTTNLVNAALAQSPTIDSDSDGIPNSVDPTPFFLPSQINLTMSVTNQQIKVLWTTIPHATNFVYYSTNLMASNCWMPFNFQTWYYGNNVAKTNAVPSNSFTSPQIYINNASLPDNSQQTNVWVFDMITNVPHYYKVVVAPWLNFPE